MSTLMQKTIETFYYLFSAIAEPSKLAERQKYQTLEEEKVHFSGKKLGTISFLRNERQRKRVHQAANLYLAEPKQPT